MRVGMRRGSNGFDPQRVSDLLVRAQQEDDSALADFIECVEGFIVRVLVTLVGSIEAEDICQEVVLRIVSRLHELDPNLPAASLLAYLSSSARHAAVDFQRKESRRPKLSLTAPAGGVGFAPEAPGDCPVSEAIRRETVERVRRCIASLPDNLLVPLILRLDGLSYEEIARAVGVSKDYATKLVSRAKQKLRRLLDADAMKGNV